MNILHRAVIAGAALLAAAVAPELAAAANGFATANVNQRAGPGTEYPSVTVIPTGAPVEIFGCLNAYSWCDVEWYGNRGWVFGSYLQAYYQQQPVALGYYGPQLGIPFVTFSFNNYWDSYYRNRPWYAERGRWATGPYAYAPARPYYPPVYAQPRPYYAQPRPYYPPVARPYVAPGAPYVYHPPRQNYYPVAKGGGYGQPGGYKPPKCNSYKNGKPVC